jgi:hypothetical protein
MFIYSANRIDGKFKAEASPKYELVTLFIDEHRNYINMSLREAKQLAYEIHTAIMEMEHA